MYVSLKIGALYPPGLGSMDSCCAESSSGEVMAENNFFCHFPTETKYKQKKRGGGGSHIKSSEFGERVVIKYSSFSCTS